MISTIGFFMILGRPLFVWFGIAAFSAMLVTVAIAILNDKGIHAIPFKFHHPFAITTAILATIHVLFTFARTIGL
ncbi:MAG: hypothetical protein UX66_C0026G0009 [Parcubacteria group bacterium GW2011_GWF2_46_8]|nr:MAG: hypothetical protein UX14_C0031G0005 [Parcubacteria group bacterium GW2011_GWF1_45_5]KKU47078.1 MAG: hypothetical protein UX66_C0026G0009 [Parcubacteria group bacterium GW2011_GWF2_46_8]